MKTEIKKQKKPNTHTPMKHHNISPSLAQSKTLTELKPNPATDSGCALAERQFMQTSHLYQTMETHRKTANLHQLVQK